MEEKTKWSSVHVFNFKRDYYEQLIGIDEALVLQKLGFNEPVQYVIRCDNQCVEHVSDDNWKNNPGLIPTWTIGQLRIWYKYGKH